jgi:putative FmdB family regulatory protein
MPIYEFACPKCRKIYSFLSKRINPEKSPTCPKCGNKKLSKQMSRFAMTKGLAEPAAGAGNEMEGEQNMPDFDDPKIARVMGELERDMASMDENNPRHMAHMMKKMKEVLPEGAVPKEMDIAIKRLEQGEDPEKVEAEMGDLMGGMMGEEDEDDPMGMGGMGGFGGGYQKDGGLYDY